MHSICCTIRSLKSNINCGQITYRLWYYQSVNLQESCLVERYLLRKAPPNLYYCRKEGSSVNYNIYTYVIQYFIVFSNFKNKWNKTVACCKNKWLFFWLPTAKKLVYYKLSFSKRLNSLISYEVIILMKSCKLDKISNFWNHLIIYKGSKDPTMTSPACQ